MSTGRILSRWRDLDRLLWAGVPASAALIGIAIGLGHPEALVVAVIPVLAVVVTALTGPGRWTVVLLAFAVGFIGDPLTGRLPIGGGNVYASDVLVAGAVGGLVLEILLRPAHLRPRLPRTVLLGLPLLLFLVAMTLGAMRGHERYDATLLGNPLRLVGYAAILAALPGLTPQRALRGLTGVVYAGAVWLATVATYHIATGTSAANADNLSTGGMRYIGIGAATYAAAAFLMAVLNLSAGRGNPLVHLGIALVAGFDVIVAYTRTIWLVLTIIVVIAVLASPAVRRALAASIPVATPLLAAGVLVVVSLAPNLISTLTDRIATPAGQDTSVQWRTLAYSAVLDGVSEDPVRGVGFGRVTTFSINNEPVTIVGDPHNGYIYIYAGAGVLGVASLVLLLLSFIGSLAVRWRSAEGEARTLLAWCLCVWVLLLTHAATEPVFTYPSLIIILWISMMLPMIVGGGPAVTTGHARVSRGSVGARRPSVPLTAA